MRILVTGFEGYIGSALVPHLTSRGHQVSGVGSLLDYRSLTVASLSGYDVIVHLAAHSTVPKCKADPTSAINNNVLGFASLLSRLTPDQRVVYATTGSISHNGGSDCREMDRVWCQKTMYDVTKYAMEGVAATHATAQAVGLRFGTVSGNSPRIRRELMINSMAGAAMSTGRVNVANPDCYRSVLGVSDLLNAVAACCEAPGRLTGVFNVASFTATIAEIGERVASHLGVPIIIQSERTECYDFGLNTEKFTDHFGYQFQETCDTICESLKGTSCGN